MEGLGQDVRVHVLDGAQGGWDRGGCCRDLGHMHKCSGNKQKVQEVCKLGCNKAGV